MSAETTKPWTAAAAATGSPMPAELGRVIERRVLTPVMMTFAGVAVLMAALRVVDVPVPVPVQLVPFAISILAFGLPHGAMDHLVPAALRTRTEVIRSIAVVVAGYGIVGGLTATLWAVQPTIAFAAFIAVTWFHWGQGDLYIDHVLGDGPSSRLDAALTILLRGSIPMLLPLAAAPADYTAVLDGMIGAVRHGSTAVTGDALPTTVRIGIAATVVTLGVAQVLVRRRRTRRIGRQITETSVLIALFVTTPPVLAVGLYFTLWHSVRHIIRLELLDPASAVGLTRGKLLAPFLRFMRSAWPVTAIALVLLTGLVLFLRTADLGVYLVFIAVLTTPHAVVVTWMDHRQRIWTRPVSHAAVARTST